MERKFFHFVGSPSQASTLPQRGIQEGDSNASKGKKVRGWYRGRSFRT